MKSLKSKVILSALVLIFALVATIGSTFAWFTVSNTVSTSNITLNVVSADSLLIKLANYDDTNAEATDLAQTNPANYSQLVTLSDGNLTTAGYFSGADDSIADWKLQLLTAVQSTYATVSANPALLNTMNPLTNPDRELVNDAVFNSSTPGGIQFKFWVMSQSAANKFLRFSTLNLEGTHVSTDVNDALEQSARVSVYSSLSSNGYIYMRNIPATALLASYDYDFAFTTANLDTYHSLAIYGAGPSLLGFNEIDDLTLGLSGSGTALTASALAALGYGTTTSNIITLVQNIPQMIIVTFWIEGWDAQSSNLINSAAFQADFKFTIA